MDRIVEKCYDIDDSILEEKATSNTYWSSCLTFWNSVKEKPIGSLNEKQLNWLNKIETALEEESD